MTPGIFGNSPRNLFSFHEGYYRNSTVYHNSSETVPTGNHVQTCTRTLILSSLCLFWMEFWNARPCKAQALIRFLYPFIAGYMEM